MRNWRWELHGGHGAGICRPGMRIGLAQPLVQRGKCAWNAHSSPLSRSSERSLPPVRAWVGPLRLSRRSQQLERAEGESELSHWAWVTAANLESVQGIGDWGHESDTWSIEHDLLSESHAVFPAK